MVDLWFYLVLVNPNTKDNDYALSQIVQTESFSKFLDTSLAIMLYCLLFPIYLSWSRTIKIPRFLQNKVQVTKSVYDCQY